MTRPRSNQTRSRLDRRRTSGGSAVVWAALFACTTAGCGPTETTRGPASGAEESTAPSESAANVSFPELLVTRTSSGQSRITIDEAALAEACAHLKLPPPPPIAAMEVDAYMYLYETIKRCSRDPAAEHYALIGTIYDGHSFRDRAGRCYALAERLDPSDYRWPYLLGRVYQELGQTQQALAELKLAAALNDDDAPTLARIGDASLNLARFDEADAAFARYVELRPDQVYGHFGRARIAYRRGDFATAAEHLERARTCDPGAHQVLYLYARTLARIGDGERARRILAEHGDADTSRELSFNDPLLQYVHLTARSTRVLMTNLERAAEARDWNEAIRVCESILQRRPDDFNMMYNLADLYRQTRRFDDALTVLKRALTINPDYPPLHCAMAQIQRSTGDPQAALIAIEKALAADPQYARALAVKGTVHLDLREWEAAEQALTDAARLAPENDTFAFYLGLALEPQSKTVEAAAAYTQALELNPDNERARRRLEALSGASP